MEAPHPCNDYCISTFYKYIFIFSMMHPGNIWKLVKLVVTVMAQPPSLFNPQVHLDL